MKNTKLIILLFLLILEFLLLGCWNGIPEIQENNPLLRLTQIPVIVPAMTPGHIVIKPTLIINRCVNLEKQGNASFEFNNINQNLLLKDNNSSYIYNPISGSKKIIKDGGFSFYISPRGDLFATIKYSEPLETTNLSRVIIFNNKGEVSKEIPLNSNFTYLSGWLNENHILMTEFDSEGENFPPSLMVLNLLDNTSRVYASNYPEIDNLRYLSWPFNRVIYNSGLNLAVYPSFGKNTSTTTLFSISKSKIIATLLSTPWMSEPVWSPNNRLLLIAGAISQKPEDLNGYVENFNEELFVFDENGNIARLTYFTENLMNVKLKSFSWSLSGEKIAFWINSNENDYYELAILDIKTGVVENLCIKNYVDGKTFLMPDKPFWSGNENILAVNLLSQPNGKKDVFLIDLVNEKIYLILTGVDLFGWINSR